MFSYLDKVSQANGLYKSTTKCIMMKTFEMTNLFYLKIRRPKQTDHGFITKPISEGHLFF